MKQKKGIVGGVIAVLSVIAVVFSAGAFAKASRLESTKEIGNGAFQVAAVAEDGKIDKESEEHITSDLISAAGMKVELSEDAKISYEIHWYNEDKVWQSSTGTQTGDFDGDIPEGVKYARIEITPVDGADDDGKISWFEMQDFLGQLTVTVNK